MRRKRREKEGGDCRRWDEEAYRDRIRIERETEFRTVFKTAFAPLTSNGNPNPDLIATASSDGSVAVYSVSSILSSSRVYGVGNCRGQSLLLAEPQCSLQGHDGPAYDVQFFPTKDGSLLLSCGDDGRIRGWRWDQILNAEDNIKGGNTEPVLTLMNPQQRGLWGALSPIPENNAMAVDSQGTSIFAAAGDSCAYCWDVEKSAIKMTFKGHLDYLHCIATRNHGNQIATGSEDGTARLWGNPYVWGTFVVDCKSGKCIQLINPEKEKLLKERFPVSCIALDESESWLACGSGQSFSVWNIPAHECISRVSTRASLQNICFDENQILAVGAEPLLSRFNINGVILSQIQCAPQSSFSVSLHTSGVIAVAGYGGLVDVISQFGSHLCTFQVDS